ncbi:hypothetical protein PN36_30220 [Candidatus Thiomargarita nelsonii]|uniref:Uncharacterized protein n=1 Tax=Candidatus Thiomargarita nelsonii TaxID=1003181 RepID=A0A4E0RN78_9GAMM|nr:hypothetical protein PN36_30220 [Candidatus Thiomargarita nelsonii]
MLVAPLILINVTTQRLVPTLCVGMPVCTALRCRTQSVQQGIPTQSVGTRKIIVKVLILTYPLLNLILVVLVLPYPVKKSL